MMKKNKNEMMHVNQYLPNINVCTLQTKDCALTYQHKISPHPKREEFALHTHDSYEIFIFIKGNMTFVVEGATYPLHPYDVIILRDNEMHDIYPTGDADYERIVINVTRDFFETNHCPMYQTIFLNRPAGKNNLIPGDLVSVSEVADILPRIEKYAKEKTVSPDTVVKCAMVEILHAFNHMQPAADADAKQNSTVRKVIDYINQNLDGDLSLSHLSDLFFVSKYHLCRVFREHTGYTISSYITNKRLLTVRDLCRNGESISTACVLAGFSGYSSFYKAYTKAYGCAPKIGLLSAHKKHPF